MYNFSKKLYKKLVSKVFFFEKLNNKLINFLLSAKGYNNFTNFKESGENYFVKKYLSSDSIELCIDIGANEGSYSSLLLKETSSNIICFEPLPFVFDKLKKNLSDYSKRCTLINKGVGKKNETLTIHYNNNATGHASFSEEIKKIDYVKNESKQEIDVVSLDEFCKKNNITKIDFIKIDVEGFEKEVLEGAFNTIKEIKPKFLQIEYNLHQLFRNTSIYYFAQKLPEYNVYQLTYDNMRKVDSKDPYSNIYMFSNFVFIHKDSDLEILK